MGTLSFTATVSLDGYAAGPDGDFQFGAPSEQVFRFHVERMAAISTEILGRRTYELMHYWESEPAGEDWGDDESEFARRWQALDIIAASSTLTPGDLTLENHRLVSDLTVDEIARTADAAPGEVEIFGPTTAAPAIRAGLVRDFRFFIVPVILGGGLRALPEEVTLDLQLVASRVFENGFTMLHYTAGGSTAQRSSATRDR
ncbi:dihydrofolate reductase family protein [Microbacterium esteraromaticum]|uniref:Dihydrofolate reductase family protein n=1 Tax=Microbacterium esteraromaticum TaxID=57043 RepID=A0A7D7WFY0_9MICO|nr:dihydrofolate reductase family protein [Microbacterium esteraromaticum]QMU97632.1 dihydrofolate reductase family protein [Microbacterium esteraromaticum]